ARLTSAGAGSVPPAMPEIPELPECPAAPEAPEIVEEDIYCFFRSGPLRRVAIDVGRKSKGAVTSRACPWPLRTCHAAKIPVTAIELLISPARTFATAASSFIQAKSISA